MPRISTFPILYDEVKQINISNLKKWGYLDSNQIKSGVLTWSRRGEKTGSISIQVNTLTEQPFIELDYKFNDEPRNYSVNLVSIPSNLGKGKIWYFYCPQTKKRCRILYSISGYFFHREAFTGCFYDSQIQSKHYRFIDKHYGAYFKSERLYEQLYKKHFKKFYAGKPTKKYKKIMAEINKAESISYNEIKRLYYS